jgi:hypothetical protein
MLVGGEQEDISRAVQLKLSPSWVMNDRDHAGDHAGEDASKANFTLTDW